ncbi:MAG: hypothetical protein Q7W53_01300, partial [Pseudomonadota bacterium]|nr:hypothetical protein [Pseudomonadota bacterium]
TNSPRKTPSPKQQTQPQNSQATPETPHRQTTGQKPPEAKARHHATPRPNNKRTTRKLLNEQAFGHGGSVPGQPTRQTSSQTADRSEQTIDRPLHAPTAQSPLNPTSQQQTRRKVWPQQQKSPSSPASLAKTAPIWPNFC